MVEARLLDEMSRNVNSVFMKGQTRDTNARE